MSTVTCVSGYWKVENKHKNDDFTKWFETTLRINWPYIFFGTKETIELAKKYRRELPTYYIELNIEEFYTYKYKDKINTDPRHCPSVELNLIWNEKIFLIEKAKTLNIFDSEFFMWVDAGICSLRSKAPSTERFPNLEKLSLLPTNKFIFTSSDCSIYEPEKLGSYYHFIAGTAYLVHESVIETVSALYRVYMDEYIELNNNIYTDQVILTFLYNDYPELFHQIGHGYGELVNILSSEQPVHNNLLYLNSEDSLLGPGTSAGS